MWKKGQSGNPGGRPKGVYNLRVLARERTDDALNTLTSIMGDQNAPAAARVTAACAILDRGYGRPVQSTEITGAGGGPVETTMSSKELARQVMFSLRAGEEDGINIGETKH